MSSLSVPGNVLQLPPLFSESDPLIDVPGTEYHGKLVKLKLETIIKYLLDRVYEAIKLETRLPRLRGEILDRYFICFSSLGGAAFAVLTLPWYPQATNVTDNPN